MDHDLEKSWRGRMAAAGLNTEQQNAALSTLLGTDEHAAERALQDFKLEYGAEMVGDGPAANARRQQFNELLAAAAAERGVVRHE